MSAERPSIVLIVADQWRWDARSPSLTPHLSRLEARAARFEEAITSAPLCRPARITLVTGQPVAAHGFSTNLAIPDPSRHPSHVRDLAALGYRTALVGKSHLTPGYGHLDDHRAVLHAWGWSRCVELPDAQQVHVRSAYTDWLTATTPDGERDKAVRRRDHVVHGGGRPCDEPPWRLETDDHLDVFCARTAADLLAATSARSRLASRASHAGDAPLYLTVCFPGPHPPFDAPSAFFERVRVDVPPAPPITSGPPLPSRQVPRRLPPDELRALRRAYLAKVALVDHALGMVLDAVDGSGLDPWVIVTADHGELLGDHGLRDKVVPYEGALRVPLVIRPPGGIAPRTLSGTVDLVDVVDTVRAIAEGTEGGLLGWVRRGEPPGARERARIAEAMGLVTERSSLEKRVWSHPDGALVGRFDLAADPGEHHNRSISA